MNKRSLTAIAAVVGLGGCSCTPEETAYDVTRTGVGMAGKAAQAGVDVVDEHGDDIERVVRKGTKATVVTGKRVIRGVVNGARDGLNETDSSRGTYQPGDELQPH